MKERIAKLKARIERYFDKGYSCDEEPLASLLSELADLQLSGYDVE